MLNVLTPRSEAEDQLAGDSDLSHQERPFGLEPQHPPGLVVADQAVVVRESFWLLPS